jgi:Ras family protein A
MFETYSTVINVDDKRVGLQIRDTPGMEEYARLRVLAYPDSHAVLICFAIDNPDSLDYVQEMVSTHFH